MSVTAVPLQPVKRSYIWSIWIGVVVAVVAAFLLARQGDYYHVTASGLKYHQITAGTGANSPTDSDVALVSYTGMLSDGTVFDQSQQPVPMQVNALVPGFSEALKLMRKGAHYRVWLPAKLAYGDKAPGKIPPNSPLIFDIQLIDFLPRAVVEQYQRQMQMMQGGGAGAPGGMGPAGPAGPPPGAGEPGAGESVIPPTGQ